MKYAARVIITRANGVIVSISSVAGAIRGLGTQTYTGSRHAIVGPTKNVAAELRAHGIRVNYVSPYAVPTGFAFAHLEEERTADAVPGFRDFIGTRANFRGIELTADDVANTVLYLACDGSE
ncbi:hypothetical protein HHK36_017222 [Tetracentron sinense]|uniref:Uncharacterized protein n=1 Tax=Tetracentron sinense TaxID=13715 RepID=A0A834Z2T3_TETSI|nr:hypothetical protein HHK36_017222 [Tetracentron sinense]